MKIVCACYNTLFIYNSGQCYICGSNSYGQLCNGNTINSSTPILINQLSNIKGGGAGYGHFIVFDDNGDCYGFGQGVYGELGLGDSSNHNTPQKLNISNIIQIKCGLDHSILLSENGQIYGTGQNIHGELGLGNITKETIPTLLSDISNIKEIECGGYYTILLDNENNFYSTGYNSGQLGLGDNINRNTFQKSSFFKDLGINIKKISCGQNHTLFLLENGLVYSCGNNVHGQLGLGDTNNRNIPTKIESLSNIINIYANSYSSFFIDSNHDIYVCGNNINGELGTENKISLSTPTKLNTINNIANISGNGYTTDSYTVFLNLNNEYYSCGQNNSGQLGNGTTENILLPTKINTINSDFYKSFLLYINSKYKNLYNYNESDSEIIDTNLVETCGFQDINLLKTKTLYKKYNFSAYQTNIYRSNLLLSNENIESIIGKMELINNYTDPNNEYFLLEDENNNIYTIDSSGNIIQLDNNLIDSNNFIENGFQNKSLITNLDLNNKSYYILMYSTNTNLFNNLIIYIDYYFNKPVLDIFKNFEIYYCFYTDYEEIPKDLFFYKGNLQTPIIVESKVFHFNNIAKINNLTFNTNEPNNSYIKFILSNDEGTNWYTYNINENKFLIIENNTDNIINKGITTEIINNIPSDSWNKFINDNSLKIIILLYQDNKYDELYIDSITINYLKEFMISTQKQGKDYNYEYVSNNLLNLYLYNNGDYKINYFPPYNTKNDTTLWNTFDI